MIRHLLFLSALFITTNGYADVKKYVQYPFNYSPNKYFTYTIDFKDGKIVSQRAKHKTQTLVSEWNSKIVEFNDHLAQVADFNFDGTDDLAIYTASGYGGVNQFYEVFFWDEVENRFFKETLRISNPELKPEQDILVDSTRSGAHWYTTQYKFKNDIPYIWSEAVMISDGFDHVKFYDANGAMTHTAVLESGQPVFEESKPAIATVKSTKAWLYNKPYPTAKTHFFVKEGETVELLDYQDQFGEKWFLISSEDPDQGRKWLQAEMLWDN